MDKGQLLMQRIMLFFLSSVDFNLIENDSSAILLFFAGVPEDKLTTIEMSLREKLKDCADFHFLHSGTVEAA
jgi:hypothetical protein